MPLATQKSPLPVCKEDLDNLRASGLTDETIRDNALYTEFNAGKISSILKWNHSNGRCLDGGLVFRYRDLQTEKLNGYARVRPHRPRIKDGKPVKYEAPVAEPNHVYIPKAGIRKIKDGKSPILIVEGEKKGLLLSQHGYAVIAIPGVWSWKVKDLEELIPDLASVPWTNREVLICFDWDSKLETREQVNRAAERLARALRKAGTREVYRIVLPPGPQGAKLGVDDYVMREGEAAFRALVKEARPVGDAVPLSLSSGRTDAANARRFASKIRPLVRWVGPWDKFLVWNGRKWKIDQELEIESLAKETAADLWREIGDQSRSCGENKETLAAMVSFAKSSNGATGIRNMVGLVRSEPGISIDWNKLDADPWLLNAINGTIDLRTGLVREHRREDFLTKLAPITFNSKATCPLWLRFLDKIFNGDALLIGYLQRLAGYSLTGVTTEHILPFPYGIGANGKSTFIETMLALMGLDYAMKAPPDLLMAKRGEAHPTERADLFGKRFVACIETEEGRRLAEALVKELTGGDRIRARRMREDFWEFAPTHHVWLVSNHKPNIVGTDNGIWRRIKFIPFNVVLPDADQDKNLLNKLKAELPGILNWALQGCLDWQKNGLQEPQTVQAATKSYSEEMDDIGQFLDEHCELGEFMAPATELYLAFLKANPTSRMEQKQFGSALRHRGFTSDRITRGVNKAKHGWRGLRLRSDAEQEAIYESTEKFMAKIKSKKEGK